MCLAVPGRIEELDGRGMAAVDLMGARREVSVDLLPAARVGDFVLVHAGFAIEIISPEDAAETLSLVQELIGLAEGGR
ncbi:MAG: HypC/HybG/HupF family hydrogenase formation chaperone [Coriobacteriales bacterium]|jgi:hydrogenase expression/formation protein HypC